MNRVSLFSALLAVSLLSGCSDTLQIAVSKGKIGIRTPRISVQDTKSSEIQEYSFRYSSKQAAELDVTITGSVSPIDNDGTKASELTTANFSQFYMDAYLGDEIMTCSGASAADKSDRHFMKNAEARKTSSGWTFVNDQKWRSCVTHHFWGHSGSLIDFAVSGSEFNKAVFSYNNDGNEDVLVSNHVQYYDDVLAVNRNDDEITELVFKHVLSEIAVNVDNLVMKEFDINGSKLTSSPVRCSVEDMGLISYTSGKCTVNTESGWNLAWSDIGSLDMTALTEGNIFVIPQATPNLVSMLYVYDNKKKITLPLFFELGVSGAPTTVAAGSRYTYKIKGDIVAPYWESEGISHKFTGKDFSSFCILKDLATKYVKKVRVTWTGMAASNSAGTYIWMSCETGDNVPDVSDYPTDAAGLAAKPLIGFAAAFTTGGGNPGDTPLKGEWVKTDPNDLSTWELSGIFDFSDISANTPVSFYMVYDGGNNSGQANWSIVDVKIEVLEFKVS